MLKYTMKRHVDKVTRKEKLNKIKKVFVATCDTILLSYFQRSLCSFHPKTVFFNINLASLLYFSLSLTFFKIFLNLLSCFEHVVLTSFI